MSAKLACTSLHESGTEDRPFDGQEFHIFDILQTLKNCWALCSINCFLSYTSLPPCYNLRSRRRRINISINVPLNKQVLYVNFQYSFFHKVTKNRVPKYIYVVPWPKSWLPTMAIDSLAVTVYEWEKRKKRKKKERSQKWKSATNSLKILPFHKEMLRVIVVSSLLWKGFHT